MKIIKRNGSEVAFDITKIIVAITKANDSVEEVDRMTPVQIQRIAESVELQCQKIGRAPTVEEIQDMVEHYIMAHGAFEVAKHYITYRYTRSLVRKSNTTDDKILSLIECNNEEAKQENSNKNPVVNSTQRDYMAGEVSRDLTNRILLPDDIVKAHEEGITKSWISSTVGARPRPWQAISTLSAMRWIWTGVMRASSSATSLALLTAAMILTISNSTSAPLRLMTFMSTLSFSLLK